MLCFYFVSNVSPIIDKLTSCQMHRQLFDTVSFCVHALNIGTKILLGNFWEIFEKFMVLKSQAK